MIHSRPRMGRLRKETLSGAKWQMLQKMTLEPVQMLFAMVLARLITPAEMGVLGLTAVFFAVASQLASAGFGSALIRKVDRTEEDINTAFWFNTGMSFLMALCLFLAAPWFAEFYNQPDLVLMSRISAGLLFLNSFASVHWTLFSCRRDFKTPAIIHTVVALISMPVCLVMAYMGFSYWSVLAQSACSATLHLVTVWIVSPWKPRFIFSKKSFAELFGFGSKLAASGLLFILYKNLRTFIIGKFYSPADLGLYTRGDHVAAIVPNTVGGMLDSVSYPILSTVQNDDARLVFAYRKYICVSTLVLAWGSLLLCAMAEPLVRVMYGATWLLCVPFLQVATLNYALNHVSIINLNLLKVKGRSDLFLRLEIIKRVISIGMILYAATISVLAICWATVIYTQIAIFINCYYTGKIIKLTWWQQQKDYVPYVLWAALSAVPAWGICSVSTETWCSVLCGGEYHAWVYGVVIFAQIVLSVLSSLVLYFGTLQWRRDAAYIELLRCLQANGKLMRIGFLRRWCERVVPAA